MYLFNDRIVFPPATARNEDVTGLTTGPYFSPRIRTLSRALYDFHLSWTSVELNLFRFAGIR